MRSLARREATCTSRVRPVPLPAGAPHLTDDLLPPEHDPGALREQRQQVELLAGQLDDRTLYGDLPGGQFDADGAQQQRGLAAGGGILVGGAPADGVDPGEQLAGVVGLDDVVVGAEVESVYTGADVGTRGDHDHRGAGALADLAAHLVPVLVGQAEVEQDDAEAGAFRDERLEGLLAAARVRDVEAVPCQDRGQSGGDVVVVLDEEQSHPGPLRFIDSTDAVGTNAGTRARAPRQSR
ncbi:hypothetical protein GCM10020295_21370 [Streptomyces cinereospinus]